MSQTYQLPANGSTTITTCGGTLYDDGGANGTYSANADGTITLVPATAGNKIRLEFTSFNVETSFDRLSIYDGSNTAATLIGTYDSQSPGTVYATTAAGTLTVRFSSDYTVQYNGFAATIACVTSVPQADLAIQGASAQPLAVAPGNSLSVNCTVYNLSGATANSSSVGYYLSTDAILSANDVLLGNSVGGMLGSNQSSYRSATLPVPASTPPGNYYLLFAADYLGVVNESNENNNVASISLNVVPPSTDLVVQQTSVNTPNTAPGNSLSLSCTIVNQGNTTANFSSVGYYLSTDITLDSNDQLLTSSFGGQLTPSFSQYRSATTNVPPGTTPGNYYILFAADYQNVVNESNETNNVAAVSITVSAPSVDLVVQTAQLSQNTVVPGAFISASAYIFNQGNTTANTSNTGVYLSTDATLSSNDQLLVANAVSQLTTNQGSTVYPQFTVPSTLTPGTYYVLFVADDQNAVTETNEANNVRSIVLTVLAPTIDLTIQQPYLNNSSALPGSSVTTNSYVYNLGNSSAASSSVGYYLSADNVLSSNDILVGSTVGGVLAGNNSNYRSGSITIPAGTAVGAYYVFFVVDYQNSVAETNENNNTTSTTLNIVAPGIDLQLTQPSVSQSSAGAGIPFNAFVTINNQGNSATQSSNVGYYLSTDNVLSANDVLLGSTTGGYLSANDYSSRSANLLIPSGTTPGSYYLLYVADHTALVNETNENNNVVALSFTVSAPFNGIVVPYSGTATITTCNTTVYDHGGTGIYNNGAYGSLVINPGTAGSKIQLVFNSFSVEQCCDRLTIYDGPTTSSPIIGTYYTNPGTITATNSTGALTLQFNTDFSVVDNGFEATVSCVVPAALPDLVPVLSASNPTSATTGSNITLFSSIRNQGSVTATSSTLSYYFSTNTTLDASDILLSSVTGGALPFNQSATRNAQVTIPSSVSTTGYYYILYVADPQNSVTEISETNNVTFTSLFISAPILPDLMITQAALSSSAVMPGGIISASCMLNNQGNSTAPQSAVGYYLSTDVAFSANDIFLGNSQAGLLSPSSSQPMGTSLIVPANIASGTYHILFVADHVNDISEANETNNVATRALTVGVVQGTRDEQLAGLTLSVFPNPATIGKSLTVQLAGAGNGKTANLSLYDALGRQISQQQLTLNSRMAPVSFDTHTLRPGIYVLRLTGAGLNATRRIVVE
ncbi:CARDB domain-containing protein [Hymenobacter sp. YC55]|uniref:CARDB domain-containing protein n=1 Tax=Hymenobacter sp. YC55 TaxID=3034019 RepID=UPI0023FA49A8|nr:CARDB domain-containing protein [Hymenobacter sp. YC55]